MSREQFKYDDVSILCEYLGKVAACDELKATPLPSAELIWWRAQLAEKRDLARRSVRAINAVRLAAVIVSVAFVIVGMLIWAPRVLGDLPVPLPLTLASLLLFACSTGGVLLIWARQR
jgi:hypothetical protein